MNAQPHVTRRKHGAVAIQRPEPFKLDFLASNTNGLIE